MCCSSLYIFIRTHLRLVVFLAKGKRVFHVSILSLVCLGNCYASGRLYYGQASTYRPRHTYYVTVFVFLCPYVCTTLAQSSKPSSSLAININFINMVRFTLTVPGSQLHNTSKEALQLVIMDLKYSCNLITGSLPFMF